MKKLLSLPFLYNIFQDIMGARIGRSDLANNFIRACSGNKVLDIGCGTAQILEYLPNGIIYYGYDISSEYIAAAKLKFKERGIFICRELNRADINELAPFDIVIATGLLHHLNDRSALNILQLANIAIKPDGKFISKDPVFIMNQNPISRFLVSRDRGCFVRKKDDYLSLARHEFPVVTGTVRHRRNWIPYTHLVMECRHH